MTKPRSTRAVALPTGEVERRFRGIVREELLRGVSDFALRQCTDDFIEALQRRVVPHVNAASQSSQERREALARLKNALESLGNEVQALLQNRLSQYSRQV